VAVLPDQRLAKAIVACHRVERLRRPHKRSLVGFLEIVSRRPRLGGRFPQGGQHRLNHSDGGRRGDLLLFDLLDRLHKLGALVGFDLLQRAAQRLQRPIAGLLKPIVRRAQAIGRRGACGIAELEQPLDRKAGTAQPNPAPDRPGATRQPDAMPRDRRTLLHRRFKSSIFRMRGIYDILIILIHAQDSFEGLRVRG
jgi:hypothetical protein